MCLLFQFFSHLISLPPTIFKKRREWTCWTGKIEFTLECKLCYKLNDDDEENHVAHKSHQRIVRAERSESQWNWGERNFTVGTGHTNTKLCGENQHPQFPSGKIWKRWHREISAGGNFLIHIETYFTESSSGEKKTFLWLFSDHIKLNDFQIFCDWDFVLCQQKSPQRKISTLKMSQNYLTSI